jgi:hypothetical protein
VEAFTANSDIDKFMAEGWIVWRCKSSLCCRVWSGMDFAFTCFEMFAEIYFVHFIRVV